MPLDTEQIIIEFISDVEGMKPAIDTLEAIGQIDKQTADQIRKTNAEYAARAKSIESVNKSQKDITATNAAAINNTQQLSKALQALNDQLLKGGFKGVVKEIQLGIQDALREVGAGGDELANQLENAFAGAEEKPKSLKAQLRLLKEELSQLDDQGLSNTEKFEQLSVSAAKLEDQIGDTGARIRALASDTRGIDAVVEGVKGVAAGFAVAQGAVGLFGEKNKEFEKTLIAVQSAQSILLGITELQNLTQKESIAVQTIAIGQKRLSALATRVETAAESSNVVVKGLATAAQYALNAAMAANPVLLLVGGIALVTAGLYAFVSASDDAAESQAKINDANEKEYKSLVKLADQLDETSKRRIASAQAELNIANASNAPILEKIRLERQLSQTKADVANAAKGAFLTEIENLGVNKIRLEELNKAYEKNVELKKDQEVLDQQKREIDLLTESVKKFTAIRDAAKEANAELKITNIELDRQTDQARLKNAQEFAAANLEIVKKGTNAELQAKLAVIEAERAAKLFEINNDPARSGEALRVNNEANKKIREANQSFFVAQLQDAKAADEAALVNTRKNSAAELELKVSSLQKQAQIELANDELSNKQRLLIITTNAKAIADLRKQYAIDEVNAAISIEKSDAERRLALSKANSKEELQAKQDIITAQEELDIIAVQNSLISEQEKEIKITTIQANAQKDREKLKLDSIKTVQEAELDAFRKAEAQYDRELAAKKDIQQQYQDFAIQSAGQIANAYFQIQNETLAQEESSRLERLNQTRDNELKNAKLTADERLKIEERYRKQESKIKNDAAKQQRENELNQAFINGALAITAILAAGPLPYGGPVGQAFAIAASGLTTGLQIAAITSRPLPKYAKGKEYVDGPGTSTSDDILARLSKGERVVTARENADYNQALHMIHKRAMPPHLANKLLTLPPAIAEKMLINSLSLHQGGVRLDEDALARKIVNGIARGLYDLNDTNRNSDEIRRDQTDLLKELVKSAQNNYDPRRR